VVATQRKTDYICRLSQIRKLRRKKFYWTSPRLERIEANLIYRWHKTAPQIYIFS